MRKKTLHIQEYELPILVHEEKEGGFTAVCPVWEGCYAQGESVEEVINEISYVAASLIELYKEEEVNIPLTLRRTAQKEAKKFSLSIPLIVSTN